MDIQATKLELIKMVVEANSEELLRRLKSLWKQAEKENSHKAPTELAEPEPEWLTIAKQPTPAHIDLDALAKEQGYDDKRLYAHMRSLDRSLWEDENIDEIMEILSK